MNSEIRDFLHSLLPLLEESIRKSIVSVIKKKDPYGYALLIDEDLEQASVVLVTNNEESLTQYDEKEVIEYRYSPDEWEDWHYEYFKEFNEKLDTIYAHFEETHKVIDEECCYTNDGMEYMDTLYSIYLLAMKKVKNAGQFKSIWYRVIWISDSDRNIIKDSFFELNEGRVIDEASYLFAEDDA